MSASHYDLPDLRDRLQSVSVPWLGLAFCFIGLNLVVVSWRLHRILKHFGSGLPFVTAVKANVSGLIASLVVVNLVGSVLGRHAVLRNSGMSASLVAAISGYERAALALVGGGLFALGALALSYAVGWTSGFAGIPYATIVPTITIATFAAYFSRSPLEHLIVEKIFSIKSLSSFLEIALITLVGQLLTIGTYAAVVIGLGHDINIWLLLGSAAIVSFAASMPISVNGWGVRELASISVFGALGIPAPDALAASIIVGICSTIGVLMSAPLLMLQRTEQHEPSTAAAATSRSMFKQESEDFLQKSASVVLSLSAAVLVFFGIPISMAGNTVVANLGDPVALIALAAVAATYLQKCSLPFECPQTFKYWIFGLTLLLMFGMVNAASNNGISLWAINNRGIGWLIIIGYICCGALIAGQLGRHGQRRLIQTLAATAASVVIVTGLLKFGNALDLTHVPLPSNFEGFSADRNAFAFQLVAVIAVFQAYMLPLAKSSRMHIAVLAILITGVILTKSTTGLASGAIVVLVGLLTSQRRKRLLVALALTAGFFAVHYGGMRLSLAGHSPSQTLSEIVPLSTASSINEHSTSVVEGLRMWRDHPIFGAGLGTFISTKFRANGEPLIVHSTIVWVLAEMGLVGLVAVAWFPLGWLFKMGQNLWNSGRYSLNALSRRDFALFGLATGFAIFGLAHDVAYQRVFWLLLGSLAASVMAQQFAAREPVAKLTGLRAKAFNTIAEADIRNAAIDPVTRYRNFVSFLQRLRRPENPLATPGL